MPLSDWNIKNAKPEEKRYQVLDYDGLYLEIMPTGKKMWRFRYCKEGKRSWHTIGEYPAIGLAEARDRRNTLHQRLRDGLPLKDATTAPAPQISTFETIASEWLAFHSKKLKSEKEKKNIQNRVAAHILPFIGDRAISAITPMDILPLLQRLSDRGTHETAARVRGIISQVFRYAAATGRADADPTYLLRGAVGAPSPKHFATITDPKQVGELLRDIDIYPHVLTRLAMKFSALTFARPGNVRQAEWTEISGDDWRIPAEKMKMKKPHIIPLAAQALEILEKMRPITGHGRYIYPSNKSPAGDRPMSENTVRVALRWMGYTNEQMTPHGFRAMATTILNENGFNENWIERQMAHAERSKVQAAYNYAEYLPDRRRMMQWYADYLDKLRAAAR